VILPYGVESLKISTLHKVSGPGPGPWNVLQGFVAHETKQNISEKQRGSKDDAELQRKIYDGI
jgi:hypothetical protein